MDQNINKPVDNYCGYLAPDPQKVDVDAVDIKFSDYLHPLARESLTEDKTSSKAAHEHQQKGKYPWLDKRQNPVNMRELRFDSGENIFT